MTVMQKSIIERNWKWVVVFGAFMVHVICDGISYAFGLILVELIESFDEGIALTSWITSVLIGVTLGSGPIAGSIANYFGCRNAVMIGSFIAAVGSFLSYFANGIVYLIISVGAIMGFGFSLMFCPSVIIVNLYFKKKRALAVGIVVCGAGIGTFIFAPLSAYLLSEYSWRGTFLIYSGLILNGVVFGALFRLPPSSTHIIALVNDDETDAQDVKLDIATTAEVETNGEPSSAPTSPPKALSNGEVANDSPAGRRRVGSRSGKPSPRLIPIRAKDQMEPNLAAGGGSGFSNSAYLLPGKKTVMSNVSLHHDPAISLNPIGDADSTTARTRCLSVMSVSEYKTSRTREDINTGIDKGVYEIYMPLRPIQRKDIFFSGFALDEDDAEDSGHSPRKRTHRRSHRTNSESAKKSTDMNMKIRNGAHHTSLSHGNLDNGNSRNNVDDRFNEEDEDNLEDEDALDLSQDYEIAQNQPTDFLRSCLRSLRSLTDVSLLREPVFLLVGVSNFLTNIGYDLPRIFLPDKAEHEMGITASQASWLLSIWGICNTVGRVGVGYVCDTQWALDKRLWIYNISLVLAGIVNIFSPLCTSYAWLALYSALFGLFLSTYISLTSVVLVDLLGLERLTNAFGLLLFFQGLGAIVGPPIGGLIVDSTKSYNFSFIFAGIVLVISGVMLFPIAISHNRKRRHRKSSSMKN